MQSLAQQRNLAIAAVAVAALAISASPAFAQAADTVADFYRGKQIKFIIRAAPGGGFDLYSRLLGRHIVKHIPGHPTVLPRTCPAPAASRRRITWPTSRPGTAPS